MQIFARLLQIRRDEGGLVLLALAFAFSSVAETAVIRIFADAILLTEFGPESLPAFFVGSSLAFMAASLAYAWALGVASSVRLNTWLLASLAVFCVIARHLFPVLGPSFVFALSLLLTVAAPLARILCWNAITECFDIRQAKRLLPIAGAGSTVGAIVAGLAAVPFVRAVGTDDLLYIVALLFAAMAPMPRWLAARALPAGGAAARPRTGEGYWRATAQGLTAIRKSRLVATVAGMLFLGAVVTSLLDYSLKTAIQDRFGKDEMAIFLGHFQALANALILLLQLLVVGRVLVTFGVRFVFALLPVTLLGGGLLMALEPIFTAIVGLNFFDLLLRYTFQNAGSEMVLTPVPTLERNRAKVVIKGVMVPLGGLVAGLLLFPLQEIQPDLAGAWQALGWTTAALAAASLYLVVRVKHHYLAELRDALGFGRLVHGATPEIHVVMQDDAVRALVRGMEEGRPEEVDFSIDLLARSLRHIPQARRVLAHPDPRVRSAALRAIGNHRLTRHRRRVLDVLDHEEDPEVLRAALVALRNLGDPRGIPLAQRLANHPDLRVQAVALAFLVHTGPPTEARRAREAAQRWMAGPPEERRMAAVLIGEIGAPPPGAPAASREPAPWDLAALGDLLSDRDVEVRRAAYDAVGRARVQIYVPRLVQALAAREEARAAAAGLRQLGPAAVPVLARAYRQSPRHLKLRIAQTLGGIEAGEAVFALIDLLKEPDAEVRRVAIRSLHRLRRSVSPRAFLRDRLLEAVLREVRLGHLCYGLLADARRIEADPFFVDEVHRRLDGTLERIFELLGLVYDPRVMRALYRRFRIGPAPARANTLELLENMVEPELRRPLMRLLEDAPAAERAARARAAWALPEEGSFAATLLEASDDRWLQRTLLAFAKPELARRYPSRHREVDEMVPILQRVMVLKSVPLFSELSGETLYPVAEIAEEVQVPQGTVIFEEGDVGNYLYVVVRGLVEIARGGEIVARCGPRDAFGEMALLDERPRNATAVAREDTELLRIASEPFADLIDQHPEISRGIIRVLLSHIRGREGPAL